MEKLGSTAKVQDYWNDAAPHLQARYCHSTLGTKIKIERIGKFKHYSGTLTASGENLKSMQSTTAKIIGSADLMVYMCHDPSPCCGTVGMAYVGSVCGRSKNNKNKQSINEWRKTPNAFAGVNQHF